MKKNQEFVTNMRIAGKIAAKVLNETLKYAREGVTTNELDKIADDLTLSLGAVSACTGYRGYPKSICVAPNDVLCHGVPDGTVLKGGDIINIDVTVKYKGYHGDTSATIYVPKIEWLDGKAILDPQAGDKMELIEVSRFARDAGIMAIRPGGMTGDIGHATMRAVAQYPRYQLNTDIGGHGIGKVFHDAPFVPATGLYGRGEILKPWTCITVEPIVVDGDPDYSTHGIDGSQVKVYKTLSGKNSSHFEHTVLITDSGFEILTVE